MERDLLSCEEIDLAVQGDPIALDKAVSLYLSFIRSRCLIDKSNQYGQQYSHVDRDMVEEVTAKLMLAITKFDKDRIGQISSDEHMDKYIDALTT